MPKFATGGVVESDDPVPTWFDRYTYGCEYIIPGDSEKVREYHRALLEKIIRFDQD
jgi:hypothetical protein